MPAAADVKALFPHLSTLADATVDLWISVAEGKHCAEAFGTKSENALIFLAAHFCELQARRDRTGSGGAVGPLSSRTVGPVSTSYAAAMPTAGTFGDAALASTQAGQMYLDLREGIFADRRV